MLKSNETQPQTINYFRVGYQGVVAIAGDFNSWNPQNMVQVGQEGEYQIQLEISAGRHHFCFFERPSDRALIDKT